MNVKMLIELIENLVDPEKSGEVKETAREELQNTKLHLVDKAIIDAYLLQHDGELEDAIEKWRAIAKIAEGANNELAAHAWLSVGCLLAKDDHEQNFVKETFFAYKKAIDLKPDYADAYYNRGNLKRTLEDVEDALVDYDAAIKLNPLIFLKSYVKVVFI